VRGAGRSQVGWFEDPSTAVGGILTFCAKPCNFVNPLFGKGNNDPRGVPTRAARLGC
jgi:hypothetical protein